MEINLVKIFKPFLDNPIFKETSSLVEQNSQGKIWIIGWFVYKNLASSLYGTVQYEYDIDFIVEHKNEILKKVDDWNIEVNSYLNPNYVREGNKMSFTDIHKTIRASGFGSQTIEDFILYTPLNIQSIAYDILDDKLIGDIGINALKEKIVKVNNLAQAEFFAQRKNKTLKEIITEKARELDFQAVF